MSRVRTRRLVLLLALAALGGCAGPQSALDPRGPRAAWTLDLGWLMFGLAGAVFLLVLGLLLGGLFRRRPETTDTRATPVAEGRIGRFGSTSLIVAGGILLPLVVLSGLTVVNLRTLAAIAAPPGQPDLRIEVIGHQFWWEVRYPDQQVVTANEIRVPTGRSVQLTLTSPDVIHSFWVPALMGKMDMIPGRTNVTWLQASQPGEYRGQCAEYCGIQHARMAFLVIAEAPDQFAAWVQQQRQPAAPPTDPFLARGAQTFAREGCISCHVIRSGDQPVGGQIGPDLTHVGSRRTLAAGTLPNNLGAMEGWIGNPQGVKPGANMPALPLDAESLRAVAAYLESLK